MKLKKALKLAKDHGYKFIAVDKSKEIYFYHNKPNLCGLQIWSIVDNESYSWQGMYTGNKHWKDTLREVK